MFPMELDHRILSDLPLPTEQGEKRVLDVLGVLVSQRILPWFRDRRGTDPIKLARIEQSLCIQRMEDGDDGIRLVSLIGRRDRDRWIVGIHERLFDYMVFIIPTRPAHSLVDGSSEKRRILTFAEFMLRHNLEHILYPQHSEEEVIRYDVSFAMAWHGSDPTAYRMLRAVLSDRMSGLRGEDYLELLDQASRSEPFESVIDRIVKAYVCALEDLPTKLLDQVFLDLDSETKTGILGKTYGKAQNRSRSLRERAFSFQRLFELFSRLIKNNPGTAEQIFRAFASRWNTMGLFHELDLPEKALKGKEAAEVFEMLRRKLSELFGQLEDTPPVVSVPAGAQKNHAAAAPVKDLKERIEDARKDPHIPQPVMELIDKNRLNIAGSSAAKYTELIETLLAIPWGRIRKIVLSPAEFEEGLNRTHYGIEKPKEIICDYFANLIWRHQHIRNAEMEPWQRTGSALLFVGPPGVGKTSLAISIAQNLGIPYHKISLGGMKDEADIRGYGFTYEGSKPGSIVQGLIKMGVMNGMFILDEADKTEKFAIATLLEILDPEQNHLFHDKFTQSTIDIDLSNCHFILTANTLDTVPPAVLDRCEVVFLDQYSVEEKIAIAREHLIGNVRQRHMIREDEIFFDTFEEKELLRWLIRTYTTEAGVRDLERALRTLFLRIHRKEILAGENRSVRITMRKIKEHLAEPTRPARINEDDRVGEIMGLGINMEMGFGSLIPIQVTPIAPELEKAEGWPGHMSIAHATGNIEKVMDESRKVASTAISYCARVLGTDPERVKSPVHLHFMGGSTRKDGPSAGVAIALALASFFMNEKIRRDVAVTGEIDTQGRITRVGGLSVKLETAYVAGCKTLIIPKDNLHGMGGIERLPDGLKQELQILTHKEWKERHEPFDYKRHMLQVVAVDHIIQAADVAFIREKEFDSLVERIAGHACRTVEALNAEHCPSGQYVHLAHVSAHEKLDLDFYTAHLGEPNCRYILLVSTDAMEAVRARLSSVKAGIEVQELYDDGECLSSAIQRILESRKGAGMTPLSIAAVAPLALLQRTGIRMEQFPLSAQFDGLRLFACCCTIEKVWIRDCRGILNRVFHYLSRLPQSLLGECPFLARSEGIYGITVSAIPEKYRLDAQRAELIMTRCLSDWLSIVEAGISAEGSSMYAIRRAAS